MSEISSKLATESRRELATTIHWLFKRTMNGNIFYLDGTVTTIATRTMTRTGKRSNRWGALLQPFRVLTQ